MSRPLQRSSKAFPFSEVAFIKFENSPACDIAEVLLFRCGIAQPKDALLHTRPLFVLQRLAHWSKCPAITECAVNMSEMATEFIVQ